MKQTKESQLALWCKEKSIFSKAELYRYGGENYYISAWRRVCEWVNETPTKVRILGPEECKMRGLKGKMRYYAWVGLPNIKLKTETKILKEISSPKR